MHAQRRAATQATTRCPQSGSPQDIGKAITYARRYALCAVTGLAPGGDDDDGKSATDAHHEAQRKPRTVPDAQLAAEGRMTREAMAGHKKMQADTLREPKRAERSRPKAPDPGRTRGPPTRP